MKAFSTILMVVSVGIALGIGGGLYLYYQGEKSGPLTEPVHMVVGDGASIRRIAVMLEAHGAIESALLFEAWARVFQSGRMMQAGEYLLPVAVSYRDITDRVVRGAVVLHRLTIPEGLRSAQIMTRLQADSRLRGEVGPTPPEGSLLPETYTFARNTDRKTLIALMQKAMQDSLEREWQNRDPSVRLADKEEALILASIVEKETGVAEERPLVAAVFLNRLHRRMRLQSDPTVIYGLEAKSGAPLKSALSRADLRRKTPYNTYLIFGLPPAPIANPGQGSLHAVLHPAPVSYLYFVADGNGGHAFAYTLEEHNDNVRRWRVKQRENP